jgi:hypothetical protein
MKAHQAKSALVLIHLLVVTLAQELHYTKDEIRDLISGKPLLYNSLLRIKNTVSGHQ